MMKLAELARRMRATADGQGRAHTLRGLTLTMKRMYGVYVLSAGRLDVYPSMEEARILEDVFGIPLGTEPRRLVVRRNGRRWFVVRWEWREVETSSDNTALSDGNGGDDA